MSHPPLPICLQFYHDQTLPIDPRGHLLGTGDDSLNVEVGDAIDLCESLAKSDRVRQSIIRHVFRYFLCRNEVLSDSKTLIDADQASLKRGGSFDAVIVSLLTSDSLILRKPRNPEQTPESSGKAIDPEQL